jgi:hypothetical protein
VMTMERRSVWSDDTEEEERGGEGRGVDTLLVRGWGAAALLSNGHAACVASLAAGAQVREGESQSEAERERKHIRPRERERGADVLLPTQLQASHPRVPY